MRLINILIVILWIVTQAIAQPDLLQQEINTSEANSSQNRDGTDWSWNSLFEENSQDKQKHNQPFGNIESPNQIDVLLEDVEVGWVQEYSFATTPSEDFAKDIAVDDDGNVYVTGYSEGASGEYDISTVKYLNDGSELWVARYDGLLNLNDRPVALAVDINGNVYVTGNSEAENGEGDIVTIKYSADGIEEWVNRYFRTEIGNDRARGLIVDELGNVYVTGDGENDNGDYDFVTIKYSADGSEEWVRHFDGLDHGNDYGTDIQLSIDGNICVVGRSNHLDGPSGATIIKYSTEGEELWLSRYINPDSFGYFYHKMATDLQGNIYVIGTSVTLDTTYEFETIKYSAEGIEEWVANYENPGQAVNNWDFSRALAVETDADGNVYVCGQSIGDAGYYDYATIKYGSDGSENWVARYDGLAQAYDIAYALEVDMFGSVYVTGVSQGLDPFSYISTVKYTSDGSESWVVSSENPVSPSGSDIALDNLGNVYLVGSVRDPSNESDFLTMKYTVNGVQSWESSYDGPGYSSGGSSDMLLAGDGSIYIAGSGHNRDNSSTMTIINYTTDGNSSIIFEKESPTQAWGHSMALGPDGCIYLAGTERTTDDHWNFLTIKIYPDGTEAWAVNFGGVGYLYNDVCDIAVDNSGNIYVAGTSFPVEGFNYSIFTIIKYNPDGSEAWVSNHSGADDRESRLEDMTIDSEGNVFVTGASYHPDGTPCATTIKYNPDGSEAWVARYVSPSNGSSFATAIELDSDGHIFVAGARIRSDENEYEYLVINYDPSGNEIWTNTYSYSDDFSSSAFQLKLDDLGNAFVSGVSRGAGTHLDYATKKIRPDGSTAWVRRYTGPGNRYDQVQDLTLDEFGNVYVTGNSSDENGYDFVTIKYTNNGDEAWLASYNGFPTGRDLVHGIRVDSQGNVFVAGNSASSGGSAPKVATTIKYVQPNFSKIAEQTALPTTFVLEQNYPNPFNPTTTIRYGILEDSNVSLVIYDLRGNVVQILESGYQSAGWYNVDWSGESFDGKSNSTGIYFARLVAGDYSQVIKMLYLK